MTNAVSVQSDGTKRCGRCREFKPTSEFYLNPRATSGYTSRCRICERDAKKISVSKNPITPEKRKEYTRRHMENIGYEAFRTRENRATFKRTYGITWEERLALLEAQGGLCKICGADEEQVKSNKGLVMDHDHTTGKVRGLLCSNCNVALGLVSEDPLILQNMIEYIRHYERGE